MYRVNKYSIRLERDTPANGRAEISISRANLITAVVAHGDNTYDDEKKRGRHRPNRSHIPRDDQRCTMSAISDVRHAVSFRARRFWRTAWRETYSHRPTVSTYNGRRDETMLRTIFKWATAENGHPTNGPYFDDHSLHTNHIAPREPALGDSSACEKCVSKQLDGRTTSVRIYYCVGQWGHIIV